MWGQNAPDYNTMNIEGGAHACKWGQNLQEPQSPHIQHKSPQNVGFYIKIGANLTICTIYTYTIK